MALESIIRGIKRYSVLALASFTFGCSSCDNDKEILTKSACIEYEICGNRDKAGEPLDDNCNGEADELCDEDGDGYCGRNYFSFKEDIEPSICPETYKRCLDDPSLCEGDHNCKSFASYNPGNECNPFIYDCDDNNSQANPSMEEICDGIDNNCNRKKDESFPEKGYDCDPNKELGENFELDGIGICRAGKYTECKDGQLVCSGFTGPKETELCNGKDDDCNLETREHNLTGVTPENSFCYNGPPGTANLGICMSGVKFCTNGSIGGDGICYGEVTPQEEICNCLDDDCDNEIDEGLHTIETINIAYVIDTSCSMSPFHAQIANLGTAQKPLFCASDEKIKMSLIAIGDIPNNDSIPVLKQSLVTIQGFADNFRTDIPGPYGSGNEANLNAIVYAACEVLDNLYTPDPLCEQLRPINTLRVGHPSNVLGKTVFESDAKKTIVVYSDEGSQFYLPRFLPSGYNSGDFPRFPEEINQQIVAELADAANIKVIIYTAPRYDNLFLGISLIAGGWGYFAEYGGEIRSILEINEPNDLEQLIRSKYCINE